MSLKKQMLYVSWRLGVPSHTKKLRIKHKETSEEYLPL
jgi:hypothetical protein